MALIKCPECGKEISDKADSCPECGCPIQAKEECLISEEVETGYEQPIVNGVAPEEGCRSTKADTAKPAGKSKKGVIIGAVLGAAALLCIIIGIMVSQRNAKIREQQEAEVRQIREYNSAVDNLNALYSSSYSGATDAESVCVLTINVWVDSIYKKYNKETNKYITGTSDFNGAIQNVYNDEDIQKKLTHVKDIQSKLNTYIQELQKCPEELQKCYDAALQVHATFNALAELALAPSGNITSYKDSEQQKIDNYSSAFNILGALIPAKKQVPLYDAKGNQIEDEFAFVNYLNQNVDKLPATAKSSIDLEGFAFYKDTAKICGVEGEVSYNAISLSANVISYIKWGVKNPEKELESQVLEKLRERYGKEGKGDKNSYNWYNEKTKENLVLNIKDDELSISWFNSI